MEIKKKNTHIFSLFIINKSGGLIYQRDFNPNFSKLDINEYLRLASMFHGICAIAREVSPVFFKTNQQGYFTLEAKDFYLHCFRSLTGVKFLVVTSKQITNGADTLRNIYEIYSDYVLKDPFYVLEMPIRCELFDNQINNF